MTWLFLAALATAQVEDVWFEYQPAFDDTVRVPRGLKQTPLTGCFCQPVSATSSLAPQLPGAVTGWADLRIEIRKGRVNLVSASTASPSMELFMPCIRNEVTLAKWGVRNTDLDLRVVPKPPPPADDVPPPSGVKPLSE
jgi:hypothetical protein